MIWNPRRQVAESKLLIGSKPASPELSHLSFLFFTQNGVTNPNPF